MLTIHQLEVFVTVANHLSMRAAAEELTVSQPAVSASIASLQRELGVELFTKRGRGIELTAGGTTMLGYSRRVLDLLDEAVRAARSGGDGGALKVRFGSTASAAAHVVTPWLARLRAEDPHLDFTLEVANRSLTWRRLAEREIDVALTSRPPSSATFDVLAVIPNEFILVGRPGLVWAGQLGEATWLVREEGSTMRAATEEVLARLDLDPPTMEIGAHAAMLSSVEAGLGIALLPADSVAGAVRDRRLLTVRSDATPLSVPWNVIVRAGEEPKAATRRFITALAHIDGKIRMTPSGQLVAADGAHDDA